MHHASVSFGTVSRSIVIAAAAALSLAPAAVAPAAVAQRDPSSGSATTFVHVGTVTEPAVDAIKAGKTATNPTGLFASFDISWVDNQHNLYFLADRSNNAIDEINAIDGSFVMYLGKGQFAGVNNGPPQQSGPDGVVTDNHGIVWAGDGPGGGGDAHSSLKAYDPNSGSQVANIDNGGAGRADELAFGNVGGGRILIANPNEPTNTNPTDFAFVTVVNTNTKSIVGKVVYDEPAGTTPLPAGHGYQTFFVTPGSPAGTAASQHGLEQPAFLNGNFYLNVPATIQNPGGEIDVFDANASTPAITRVIPLTTCGGTGLAIGPKNDLMVECGDSFRALDLNGHVEASVAELGGADEIWFNPGDGNVYFPLGASATLRPGFTGGMGAFDAVHDKSLGLTTIDGAQGGHSIAASARSGIIFIPSSDNPDNGAGGIAMVHAARNGNGNGNGGD